MREHLLQILESAEFHQFYQDHLRTLCQVASEEKTDLLQNYIEKIKTPECYVAILGIQGAGKSSLLNALLFGDEVLPVAVEETTCIPTMIRRVYEGEAIGAEVHFQDGRVEHIPLEREFLGKVVDNRYNHGNIMDVAFVVCRTDSPLLAQGFVFVDLPGVGSLTQKNENTTLRFLQKTNIGIFLLRTVPPITESEAGFIKVAWPQLQTSIFVQNLWARETNQEGEAGMNHNAKVLTEIAKAQNTRLPDKIIPINIAFACKSVYSKNKKGIHESGLLDLKAEVEGYAKDASLSTLYIQTAKFFLRLILKAKDQIQERLQWLNSDLSKIAAEFDKVKQKLEENYALLDQKFQQHCSQFQEQLGLLKTDWLAHELDQAMDHIMERLDRSPLEDMNEQQFRQEIREVFSDCFGLVYRQLHQKMGHMAEEYVQNLSGTLAQLPTWDQILSGTWNQEPNEKTPTQASGFSVALAGSIAPLLISGPIGWSILGGALLTGGLVRFISGSSLHQRILRGLRKTIADGKTKIWQSLSEDIVQFAQNVQNSLASTLKLELRAYQDRLDQLQADFHKLEQDQQPQREQLENDLKICQLLVEHLSQIEQLSRR